MFLCISRKFTGKTTLAKTIMKKGNYQKIIIIDTDDHPSYADAPIIALEKIKAFKQGMCRLIESDIDEVFYTLNQTQNNALIICEDSAKYIDPNVQKPVRRFIVDHRKRNFDVIFMFHFLSDIPPYIAKQYDYMFLFKTGDSLTKNMSDKFANWHTIQSKLERIRNHKSLHYHEAVAVDE